MTRYAERFNLGKLEVIIATSLLCIHSLMFPSYLRKEQVLLWGLLSGGILICTWGIWAIRRRLNSDQENDSLEMKDTINEAPSLEEEESVNEAPSLEEEPVNEATTLLEKIEPHDEVACSGEGDSYEVERFSLEEIIEKGFQAKEEGNYHLAAEWFLHALDRKPTSDIAFYLIVESYRHWKNGYSTKEALSKVSPYINEYIKDAPPEWRIKLAEWLQDEKLSMNL